MIVPYNYHCVVNSREENKQMGKHTIQCFRHKTYHACVFNMTCCKHVQVQWHAFLTKVYIGLGITYQSEGCWIKPLSALDWALRSNLLLRLIQDIFLNISFFIIMSLCKNNLFT